MPRSRQLRAVAGKHLVVKGDPEQKSAAEELLNEHEWFLADAVAEADEETYGASNFVAHHQSMVDGLSRILAVHNDPEIPDGTIVHVNRAKCLPVSKTDRWKWRTMPRIRRKKTARTRNVKPRGPESRDEYIADIVEFIREWKGVPTWEDIVNEAGRVCGHKWKRQSLNNHKAIVDDIPREGIGQTRHRPTCRKATLPSSILRKKFSRKKWSCSGCEGR